MKIMKSLLLIVFIFLLNLNYVEASCTEEELSNLKLDADKIKITYKHLGEVTKEDGSKVYNEFLVTTSEIGEGLYIHLNPMTNENFIENENNIQIKLTTGTWVYSIYSSKCEKVLKDITVKLPTFNTYSLDPLCEGIDEDDFPLCAKYYEYEFSRETFERKVNAYRIENNITESNNTSQEENNILSQILDLIEKYNLYIAGTLAIILLILIVIIINSRRKKKAILE